LVRIALVALALVLVALLVIVVMRSGPLAPTQVTVAQVVERPVTPELFGIGTVEARRSYLVGPTAAGRVRGVQVDVGDRVKTGQPLAEMDPVDLDERIAALEASSARAESTAAAAEAQRRDALAKQELASANARRYAELSRQDFISTGALEARQQEQTSAEAGVRAAEANLAAARQDQRRLMAERAGLRQLRASVRLLAPHDGVVISRDAEPGTTVVAGQSVLRLVDPASLWVRVRLDQGRSGGLAPGQPARIVLRSAAQQSLPGRVMRVEALSDSVTEERIALIGFDQLPGGLSIGELAEVTLSLPTRPAAPTVPNPSLTRLQGRLGVWRLDADGHPEFTPVRTGAASLDGLVQVLEGLRSGDSVIVHSEKQLAVGTRVRVVEALVGARP
jgi:HlyD family secretion protein